MRQLETYNIYDYYDGNTIDYRSYDELLVKTFDKED